jgi:hypothetical protein
VARGWQTATPPEVFRLLPERRRPDLRPSMECPGSAPGHSQTNCSLRAKTRRAQTHREHISRLDSSRRQRDPLHLNLSWKAGVSSIREPNPRSRLVRTGPCSRIQCRPKYLISGNYPSGFFYSFHRGSPIRPFTKRQRRWYSETDCEICHSGRTSHSNG